MQQDHVPGCPEDLSTKNYLVIAKSVRGKSGRYLNLNAQYVEQLYCAATQAPHYDLHCGNYVLTDTGQLVIIDTDRIGMPSSETQQYYKNRYIYPTDKLKRMMYSKYENYNQEACERLTKLLREE